MEQSLFFNERDTIVQQCIYVTQCFIRLFLAVEVQQSSDDVPAPVGLDDNLLEVCFGILAVRFLLQKQVRVSDYSLERIVQFMRHIGRQLPDQRQSF